MSSTLDQLRAVIMSDPDNAWATAQGWQPLFAVHPHARIAVIGQAPGRRAQESGIAWGDASGITLRKWLGISTETFYDPRRVALLPMDFYYPGQGAHGDLPPRRDFAARWHRQLLEQMPHIALTVLIGQYAQRHYLGPAAKPTLTETVRCYGQYLPQWFPLVHPSPLNFRWQARNPWFAEQVLPELRCTVARILGLEPDLPTSPTLPTQEASQDAAERRSTRPTDGPCRDAAPPAK
jgi:uracil-DNA glycosylase